MSTSREKILIIQTAFIGDVILATAFIEQVRRKYPNGLVYFLCRRGNEDLLKSNPNISEILIWDKKKKWSSFFQLLIKVRKLKIDQLFILQRFFTMGLFSVLSGAKNIAGFSTNPLSWLFNKSLPHTIPFVYEERFLHEVERNSLLLDFPEGPVKSRPQLFFDDLNFEKVEKFKSKNFFICSPCSVWATKEWPMSYWEELIENLIKGNSQVILLGGPDDKSILDELAEKFDGVINLAGSFSLRDSACLMSYAKRVFVNDSGTLHLASAVNVPTTAFFLSTLPSFGYGPLSDDAQVLEVQTKLDCRPCGIHGKTACPEGHFKCGNLVTPELALETIEKDRLL